MESNNNSCRVAHLVNRMGYGVAAGDLTKALNQHTEFESTVISLQEPSGIPDGVPVRYLNDSELSSRISLKKISWLHNTLDKFDLITAHHTFAGLFGGFIGKVQKKPLVAREGNNHQKFPIKVRVARAITGLLADQIVCVSQSVADSYTGFEQIISKSKFEVITNGVNLEAVQSAETNDWSIHSVADIDSEAFVVGTVGMLTEQKNHETLLRSVKRLRSERSLNIELVIAGDGPQFEYLNDLARDLGISQVVHFLGYLNREQVYKTLHEINCYAMPSRWEGFSAAALQAMAAGVPCVFSDIPSFSSQYPNDIARFHNPESISELAEALYQALKTDKELGDRGSKFVSNNHSIKKMAKEYSEIYRQVIS